MDYSRIMRDISQFLDDPDHIPIGYDDAHTPPNAPPKIGEPATPTRSSPNEASMEFAGYQVIDCGDPDQEIVKEIKNYYNRSSKITRGSTTHLEGNEICKQFLESGAGEPLKDIARKKFFHSNVQQGPVIIGHNPNATPSTPKMGHPSEENGITLIRLVCGSINASESGGIFKLYPASHHQSMEELENPVQPVVTSNKLFVIHGKFKWEIAPPKDCLLIWLGFSRTCMFQATRNPNAAPFMVDYKRVTLPPPGSRVGRGKIPKYTSLP